MTADEVRRRAKGVSAIEFHIPHMYSEMRMRLYRDTLRTLLDHDLPDDARALIEAALEAEK